LKHSHQQAFTPLLNVKEPNTSEDLFVMNSHPSRLLSVVEVCEYLSPHAGISNKGIIFTLNVKIFFIC